MSNIHFTEYIRQCTCFSFDTFLYFKWVWYNYKSQYHKTIRFWICKIWDMGVVLLHLRYDLVRRYPYYVVIERWSVFVFWQAYPHKPSHIPTATATSDRHTHSQIYRETPTRLMPWQLLPAFVKVCAVVLNYSGQFDFNWSLCMKSLPCK